MLTRVGKRLENLWDAGKAANMSEPEKLLYRSNLLGSDKRITNYGGGNIIKVDETGGNIAGGSSSVWDTLPVGEEPVSITVR